MLFAGKQLHMAFKDSKVPLSLLVMQSGLKKQLQALKEMV